MADEVTIAGEGWLVEELAALVAAARALFRSSELVGELRSTTDPLRRMVDGPHDRRETEDPARAEDAAAALPTVLPLFLATKFRRFVAGAPFSGVRVVRIDQSGG